MMSYEKLCVYPLMERPDLPLVETNRAANDQRPVIAFGIFDGGLIMQCNFTNYRLTRLSET